MILTTTFVNALKFANHASSKKDIRYYLMGVLFQFRGKHLHLVGTNGCSLAAVTLELFEPMAYDADLIVPNEAIKDIVKAFARDKLGGTSLKVELNEDRKKPPVLTIEAIGIRFTPKPIEGHFPDWRRVVPVDRPVGTAMPAMDATLLGEACEALKMMVRKTSPSTQPLIFTPGPTVDDTVLIQPAVLADHAVVDCKVVIGPIRN